MTQRALLITPQGKQIELTPEIYQQLKLLLAAESHPRSRAQIDLAIHATFGKYAAGTSLTLALLAEHRAERAREEKKLNRLRG